MANTTERIGVSYCSLIAAKTEWMFREQPIDDIGIDAHMERTDTDGKVQQLLALQIKSGESYFKENKGDYVVFRDIDDRQYNYWTTNTLPCMLYFIIQKMICVFGKNCRLILFKKPVEELEKDIMLTSRQIRYFWMISQISYCSHIQICRSI